MTGDLDPETIERRVLTAIKTLDASADPDRRFLAGRMTVWPQAQRLLADVIGEESVAAERARLSRFQPTPQEIDDMLPALALIGPREKPWFWLLRARAYGRSYSRIAYVRGRSDEYWRRKYKAVMGQITARAQALPRNYAAE